MSEFTKVRVLCLGTVLAHNFTKSIGFQLVDDSDNKLGAEAYFSVKGKKTFVTGVFEVMGKVVDGNLESIQPGTLVYHHQLEDKEWSAAIRIAHEANETVLTAKSQANKARRDRSDVLELMEPIRRAYHSTNADGKLAIEVRMLRYLRTGRVD